MILSHGTASLALTNEILSVLPRNFFGTRGGVGLRGLFYGLVPTVLTVVVLMHLIGSEPVEVWNSVDIGPVTPAGGSSYEESTDRFTLQGSGSDIWGTGDAFHFVHQSLEGDGALTVLVESLQNTHAWAKAGLMFRDGSEVGAVNAALFVTPGNGITFQRRRISGASTVSTSISGLQAPRWLKLERRGSVVAAFYSTDGEDWTLIGTDTLLFPQSVLGGLAVTSHANGQISTAEFRDLRWDTTAGQPLPEEAWRSGDVGAPAQPGLTDYENGAFTIRGSGNDIWGTRDNFHFVSQRLEGEGQIIARIESQQNTDLWAKTGLMLRVGREDSARNVGLFLTPGHGVVMQNRSVTGGTTQSKSVAPAMISPWLRLDRYAGRVDAYLSSDGLVWTWVHSVDFPAEEALEMGLAVCSHAPVLSRSVLDSVSIRRDGRVRGLLGHYYDDSNFGSPVAERLDGNIRFDWKNLAPLPGMGADTFSIRWQGRVVPQFSETYTFSTVSDDGVRLRVDGQLLIDDWTSHAATRRSGSISLEAGQKYEIELEYFEARGNASVSLLWASASRSEEVIPPDRLLPPPMDSDGDGLLDEVEEFHGLNPRDPADALADADGDGLSNAQEIEAGTKLDVADTDGDTIPDGWERSHGLNPLNPQDALLDMDGDGLSNLQEYQLGTDPRSRHSDEDGLEDGRGRSGLVLWERWSEQEIISNQIQDFRRYGKYPQSPNERRYLSQFEIPPATSRVGREAG
ncbi:MAG: hypothetical protein HC904_04405 [Blastochloris sp.]|nr:hypothetical protein [Blastochloris sp.]